MSISLKDRQQLTAELIQQIEHYSDPKTKQWFDNYLKGAIAYKGLKTPQVTKLVKAWHKEHALDRYTPAEQLLLCTDLIAGSFAEEKFAGTLYLQTFLLSKLDYRLLIDTCHKLFQQGYFFDWSTTDWFCTRVLDPTIVKHGLEAANLISHFRQSSNLWQRRAAIVSFRHPSQNSQYHPLIEAIIADLLPSEERFIQTGIGWVLADMSKPFPVEAEALFRQYLPVLSKEVIDRHTKHLACRAALKQLKKDQLKKESS